jgi:hypothetical protein
MAPSPISTPHYHIRWSTKSALDWQRFRTRAEAEERADELVRENETYTIEEQSSDCPFCEHYKMAATA